MTWDIEAMVAEIIATIKGAPFTSVAEPDEQLPQAQRFALVEHLGGPIDLGNLEEWQHQFRITVGVHRKGRITQERKAVRGLLLTVIERLRANGVLGDDAAALMAMAEATGARTLAYGEPAEMFMGASVTVTYQTGNDVTNEISD
jgi:hypothetical protein